MKVVIGFFLFAQLLIAKLVPTPFMTDPVTVQRAGWDLTHEYFEKRLIGDTYGIAMVQPRGTNSTVMILSDEIWHRLLYTNLTEDSEQKPEYLRAFGEFGTGSGQFYEPKGLCIDTTIYNNDSNTYFVYVADRWNKRVVKLKYLISQDTVVYNGTLVSQLAGPMDVACVSKSSGGSYVVTVEKDAHMIRLYQRSASGSVSLVQNYGTKGPGYGNFMKPHSVAICKATDGEGGYFIYVTDTGNKRVVCLRYKTGTGITWEKIYKASTDATFLSVTASQYYCVYVTDFTQNKIWVFTHGLEELLYTYGDSTLFNGPKDVYIDYDRLGLTEIWADSTGVQYFKIIPEVKVHPEKSSFDATVDSVGISFDVYETAGNVTIDVAGQTIMENQYCEPDTGYFAGYWDGRDGHDNVVVPEIYTIRARSKGHNAGAAPVVVDGTKIQSEITNLYWTPDGNPYVLIDACWIDYYDTLIIDPGVLVMAHDTNTAPLTMLEAGGVIKASGTINDSIIFTWHRKLDPPDPVYPGMWYGMLDYPNGAQDEIKFCKIEYADVGVEIWSNFDTIVNNVIQNCYFNTNTLPARCDFWSTAAFGYGNAYIDNTTNKIEVTYPPSDLRSREGSAEINDITIKDKNTRFWSNITIRDQEIPFWFRYHPYYLKYQVGGDETEVMTLTIEPGVTCEFDENTALEIGTADQWGGYARGRLVAEGLEDDSITFTGVDGGHWRGVRFCSTSCIADTSVINYTWFGYAGQDTGAIMLGDSTSIKITNTRICESPSYGLWMSKGSPYDNIKISKCVFENDSIPILSAFGNLGTLDSCLYSNNQNEIIEVVGQDAAFRDVHVTNQSIPYHFLNNASYGSKFAIYGDNTLATLTVDAGVNILCDSAVSIEIGKTEQNKRGRFLGAGNDSTPVTFSALDQSKLWDGIGIYAFDSQDTSVIQHCEISQTVSGIKIFNTSPIIKNTTVMNTGTGITVSGSEAGPQIEENIIALNTCGIHNLDTGSAVLSLRRNDIYGNKLAVRNDLTSSNVDADSNWWGAASGPWDPTDAITGPPDYNPTGAGDSIGDYVDYRPWHEQPNYQAQITLLFPNGGESLYVEIDTIIQWTRSSGINPVKQELYYTVDFPEGGIREEALWRFIDTVAVSDMSYVWNVPITPSHRCRVAIKLYYESFAPDLINHNKNIENKRKIINTSNLLKKGYENDNKNPFDRNPLRSTNRVAVDISNANFVIADTVLPQISLNYPNGGEYFIPTEQETIKWQASDNHKLDHFSIILSTDGGYTYSDTIEENYDGTERDYIWTPTELKCYKCMIKIVAYDSSGNDNEDVSDNLFYIPVKSNSDDMTAYNNARRFIRTFSSNLHLVYETIESGGVEKSDNQQNNKIDINTRVHDNTNQSTTQNKVTTSKNRLRNTNKIYYIKSTDLGYNWASQFELGEGVYPTMAVKDNGDDIGVVWTNTAETKVLYRNHTIFGWNSRTFTILDEVTDVTYSPVAIQLVNDTIHLVTLSTKQISRVESVQDVLYVKYPWDRPGSTVTDTVDHWRIKYSGAWPEFVSVAADDNNKAHIAWERPPGDTVFTEFTPFDIFYIQKGGFGSLKYNVSESDSNSINPSIDCYGGHYYIVWQEKADGYNIFLFKRNYQGFPPSSETDTLSQTSGNSVYPVSSMGGVVLWAEGDTAEIYGRIWDSRNGEWLVVENWSNTPKHSMYPQVDAWQSEGGTDIMAGWTEDTDTCGLGRQYVSYFPRKGYADISFPSYCLMLGDSMSTPFTEHRDTTATYQNNRFDYGTDSLIYYLPYINRFAKCRLIVELHRPDSGKCPEIGNKWKMKLTVDNIMNQMIELLPGEMKTLDLDVPWNVNANGSARIKFKRIKGDFILVRRVLFYEYERFNDSSGQGLAGGGPQSYNQTSVAQILFDISPTLTSRSFNIRLQGIAGKKLTLKVYDAIGRLVKTFYDNQSVKSNQTIVWDAKDDHNRKLSSGVYFIRLETEDHKATKKAILLR